MPRANTNEERRVIRERLMQTGRERFTIAGLTKTSLSELTKGAGIGKGSFYSFFDCKEALFLAIIESEETEFRRRLLADIEDANDGRRAVVILMMSAVHRLDRHPFMRLLLDVDTLRALTLRIDPGHMRDHRSEDAEFFIGVFRSWQARGWLRPEIDCTRAFEVLTAMFSMSIQTELIGRDIIMRAATEMAEALAERWCPDESHGEGPTCPETDT